MPKWQRAVHFAVWLVAAPNSVANALDCLRILMRCRPGQLIGENSGIPPPIPN